MRYFTELQQNLFWGHFATRVGHALDLLQRLQDVRLATHLSLLVQGVGQARPPGVPPPLDQDFSFESMRDVPLPISTGGKQVQRSAKVDAPGLANFVPALAYCFCLNLPAAFTQPGRNIYLSRFLYMWLPNPKPLEASLKMHLSQVRLKPCSEWELVDMTEGEWRQLRSDVSTLLLAALALSLTLCVVGGLPFLHGMTLQ